MNDLDFLIQSVDIVKKQFQSKDVEYCIKFLCCSTNLSNAGKQKVMTKHQPHSQKELHAKRKKESYAQMEPVMKKKVLSNKAIWYKSLDTVEKEKLLSHRAEQYKSLDPEVKEKLLSKLAEWFNSLNSAQKQRRAEWYKSLNPEEKGKLLSGRAEWYKILDPADKDKIISNVQANKEAHRNSVQHDLDHKITAFQSKIGKVYIIFSLFVT